MARSSWGSVRRKAKGIWEVRYPVNGTRRSVTIRGTKKDAERMLADLRIKHEGMTECPTVKQFWNHTYHDEIKSLLSPTTVNGYEQKYYHDIEPEFGDEIMAEVRPRHIQEWISTMPAATARHAKAVFSAMFSRAFALELVDDNPIQRRYVMPKRDTSKKQDEGLFSEDELKQIAENCQGECWEAPFLISGFGCTSRHEAMGVRSEDISNIEGYAVIDLKRGVHRVGSSVIVRDELKNEFRPRPAVVPPPYSNRLFDLASQAQAEADANGWEHAWLCDDGFGNVMCPNVMAQSFRRWFCDQPLKYHPFKNLRNSASTIRLTKGIDGSMVAKMLGNEERGTTEKHYERPKAREFIEAMDRIGTW